MIYFVGPHQTPACAETEAAAARLEARGYVRTPIAAWRKAWRDRDDAWFAARLPHERAVGERPWWW